MQNNVKFVYWEKQEKDLMCGLHTINSILQAPLFDEVSLSNIGIALDQREQNIMENYTSNSNVNESGNFSIQVLMEAMNSLGHFNIESIQSKANRQKDMSEEEAFVCHSNNHWFGVRKVHETWFNLNSTNISGPQIISDFYLSGFLDAIQNSGYTIFAVRGDFQEYDPQLFIDNLGIHQQFFELEELRNIHEKEVKTKKYKLNTSGTNQLEMERATKATMDLLEREENERLAKLSQSTRKTDQNLKFMPFKGEGLILGKQLQTLGNKKRC
jgi:hypothetical protein